MVSFIIYVLIAFLFTELSQLVFPFKVFKSNPKLRLIYSFYSGFCWATVITLSRDIQSAFT